MLSYTEAWDGMDERDCWWRAAHMWRLERQRAAYPRRAARRQQLREERQAAAVALCQHYDGFDNGYSIENAAWVGVEIR